jgi:chromosomal replication initiation ATPase DnaA
MKTSLFEEINRVLDSLRVLLDVSREDLFSKKRTENVALCRQIGMWFARKKGLKFIEIGEFFQRNHTNAMYAEKRIDELIPIDIHVQELVKKSGAMS